MLLSLPQIMVCIECRRIFICIQTPSQLLLPHLRSLLSLCCMGLHHYNLCSLPRIVVCLLCRNSHLCWNLNVLGLWFPCTKRTRYSKCLHGLEGSQWQCWCCYCGVFYTYLGDRYWLPWWSQSPWSPWWLYKALITDLMIDQWKEEIF